MIEISDSLPESTIGFKTLHNIMLNGQYIGKVNVGYLQKKDLKTFRRTKRKLKIGQPFGVQVFIDLKGGLSIVELGREGISEIVQVLKTKFKGLEDRDIYLLELDDDKRRIIGRATTLVMQDSQFK